MGQTLRDIWKGCIKGTKSLPTHIKVVWMNSSPLSWAFEYPDVDVLCGKQRKCDFAGGSLVLED